MADSEQILHSFCDANISLISYNMHGYNQGLHVAKHFADRQSDFILLQEHWLTPANMSKFQSDFPNYQAFGISAMLDRVQCGPLLADLLAESPRW